MVAIARITISDIDTPTPYIDPATGEWMVYDANRGDYVSTGIKAKGEKGDGLEVDDSHFNEDLPPSWYQEHHPMSTVRESKSVGVLNVTRMGFQENCLLETITNYDVVTQHAILGDAEGVTLYRRDEPKSNFTRWTKWACPAEEVEKLEKGLASAKSTIAALEQAKREIEEGKLSISDLPDKLRWIYDAFANGKTEIEGGLILSKYIGLSNSSGKVTSYISGEDGAGAHMLAAGVSGLADQDANSYLDHDGKLHLSDGGGTFLDFNPDGRFALTLFGGKLNIPGVLYAGLYNRTTLRSIYDTIPADYAYGQLKVVADARKAAKQDYCDFFLSPIGAGIDNEKIGYTEGYAITHNAGTKNYVPIVIGFDRTRVTKVDENHFEFVYHEERTAVLRSIWIVILGENRANYD